MYNYWAICLLLLTNLPAVAQNPTLEKTMLEKSLFWEVSGKGKAIVYVLGTHHLYPNDFVKQSVPIQKALKKANIVVGEIVIDPNQMRMALKMMPYLYMKDNTLKKLFSPEDYKLVDAYMLKNTGAGLAAMNTMKPIMVYQMLLAKKYAQSTGKSNLKDMQNMDNTIDGYIQKEGVNNKKTIRGLEEVEDQMKVLFDGYSLERQAEMVLELVKNEKTGADEEIQEMDKMYATQDIEALFDMTQKMATPEETQMLLTDRNNKWMPQLEKMLAGKQKIFVAVGAGHLAGKVGILTQLQAKGYTVKPIKIEVK